MALRVAVTGKTATPPLFATMEVLGRELTRKRVRAAVDLLRTLKAAPAPAAGAPKGGEGKPPAAPPKAPKPGAGARPSSRCPIRGCSPLHLDLRAYRPWFYPAGPADSPRSAATHGRPPSPLSLPAPKAKLKASPSSRRRRP